MPLTMSIGIGFVFFSLIIKLFDDKFANFMKVIKSPVNKSKL